MLYFSYSLRIKLFQPEKYLSLITAAPVVPASANCENSPINLTCEKSIPNHVIFVSDLVNKSSIFCEIPKQLINEKTVIK